MFYIGIALLATSMVYGFGRTKNILGSLLIAPIINTNSVYLLFIYVQTLNNNIRSNRRLPSTPDLTCKAQRDYMKLLRLYIKIIFISL